MTKNLIAYFSVVVFLISIVFGAGKILAEGKEAAKKIEAVEERIEKIEDEGSKELESIKKDNNATQKVVVEQSVKLDYIQKMIEKIDRKLEEEPKRKEKVK